METRPRHHKHKRLCGLCAIFQVFCRTYMGIKRISHMGELLQHSTAPHSLSWKRAAWRFGSISLSSFHKRKSQNYFGWNIALRSSQCVLSLHICLQRILYVCKSSWSPWKEVNRNVDIYYRSVTSKLTTQILWPKVPWNHRTFICLSESFPRVLWGRGVRYIPSAIIL